MFVQIKYMENNPSKECWKNVCASTGSTQSSTNKINYSFRSYNSNSREPEHNLFALAWCWPLGQLYLLLIHCLFFAFIVKMYFSKLEMSIESIYRIAFAIFCSSPFFLTFSIATFSPKAERRKIYGICMNDTKTFSFQFSPGFNSYGMCARTHNEMRIEKKPHWLNKLNKQN